MRILIAGAGIGGLTAAQALQRAGFSVSVFEAAPELKPIGAGIWVPPNGMKVLNHLGLANAVLQAGHALPKVIIQDIKGFQIACQDMEKVKQRHAFPIVTIARADLQEILANGLHDLRLGQALTGFEQKGETVEAHFTSGFKATGALLLGADGLHSRTRELLLGKIPLRYSGQTCWRGMAPIDESNREFDSGREIWGFGPRFGLSRVNKNQAYWFAVQKAPQDQSDTPGDVREKLLGIFKTFPALVQKLIAKTPQENILRRDLLDFAPQKHWTKGRVALLGDAAHSMTPNMGQGGAQAMEDAWTLACVLQRDGDPTSLLADYNQQRRKKALTLVRRSWSFGKLAMWSNPLLVGMRNRFLSAMPQKMVEKQLDQVYQL